MYTETIATSPFTTSTRSLDILTHGIPWIWRALYEMELPTHLGCEEPFKMEDAAAFDALFQISLPFTANKRPAPSRWPRTLLRTFMIMCDGERIMLIEGVRMLCASYALHSCLMFCVFEA